VAGTGGARRNDAGFELFSPCSPCPVALSREPRRPDGGAQAQFWRGRDQRRGRWTAPALAPSARRTRRWRCGSDGGAAAHRRLQPSERRSGLHRPVLARPAGADDRLWRGHAKADRPGRRPSFRDHRRRDRRSRHRRNRVSRPSTGSADSHAAAPRSRAGASGLPIPSSSGSTENWSLTRKLAAFRKRSSAAYGAGREHLPVSGQRFERRGVEPSATRGGEALPARPSVRPRPTLGADRRDQSAIGRRRACSRC
jgi:hypothetical protein